MTATRFRAALKVLGRSAASLAPLLHCHSRTAEGWLVKGPPPEVLAWVEAGAERWAELPVPQVRIVAGRPGGTGAA